MSFTSTYPISAMIGSGLWKKPEIQGQDRFEVIDNVIQKTLTTLTNGKMYGEVNPMICTPRKFRIVCEEYGFIPHSIKTCVQGNMLYVSGLVEFAAETGLYTKIYKRVYHLPQHLTFDTERLVKLFTERGQLIIEVPIVEGEELEARIGGAFYVHGQRQGLENRENLHVNANMLVQEHGEETFMPTFDKMEINYKRQEEFLPVQYPRFGAHAKRVSTWPIEEAFEVNKQHAGVWGQQQQKFVNYKPSTIEYNQYKNFGF
jgi:hypothetical protein